MAQSKEARIRVGKEISRHCITEEVRKTVFTIIDYQVLVHSFSICIYKLFWCNTGHMFPTHGT